MVNWAHIARSLLRDAIDLLHQSIVGDRLEICADFFPARWAIVACLIIGVGSISHVCGALLADGMSTVEAHGHLWTFLVIVLVHTHAAFVHCLYHLLVAFFKISF